MTAVEGIAIVVAVFLIILCAALCAALWQMTKTMKQLHGAVADFRSQTAPLLDDLQNTVTHANSELARVDGLLDTAESIGDTVDSASRLAYITFSNPLIKTLAVLRGGSRALKRIGSGKASRGRPVRSARASSTSRSRHAHAPAPTDPSEVEASRHLGEGGEG